MARQQRLRRPLLALLGLLVALAVGYLARGAQDSSHSTANNSSTRGSVSRSAPSAGASTSAYPTGSSRASGSSSSGSTGGAAGGVALSTLPPQVEQTVRLIQAGGPFPYSRDGVVFGNFERRLPNESRGFYHEYTVPTPGASTRGARRVIAGRNGYFWYTADHYDSFVRLDVR